MSGVSIVILNKIEMVHETPLGIVNEFYIKKYYTWSTFKTHQFYSAASSWGVPTNPEQDEGKEKKKNQWKWAGEI